MTRRLADTSPEVSPSPDPEVSPLAGPDVSPSPRPEASPSPDPEASPSPDPEVSPLAGPEASPSPDPEASPSPDLTGSSAPASDASPPPDLSLNCSCVGHDESGNTENGQPGEEGAQPVRQLQCTPIGCEPKDCQKNISEGMSEAWASLHARVHMHRQTAPEQV